MDPRFRLISAQVTRGTAIMGGVEGKPVLVLSREGKGRVAELLSDQMWLWARGYDGGGPYLDLLRRLAHWLMKEPDLEEEALRATADGKTFTVTRQSLQAEVPPAIITLPSGKTLTVTLFGRRARACGAGASRSGNSASTRSRTATCRSSPASGRRIHASSRRSCRRPTS